jgi:hypothetical protein
LLEISTRQGETLVLVRRSSSPEQFKRTVMA